MKRAFATVVLAAGFASGASAQEVFFSDFNSGTPAGISGAGGTESVQGFSGLGNGSNTFGGDMWRNDAGGNPQTKTSLTLTDLPAHDSLRIDLLLAIIDSWDGIGGNPGPDTFVIAVDGNTVFSHVFAIASGSGDYAPPAGVLLSGGTNLGFGGWAEIALDLGFDPSLTIAHSSSSVTIDFYATGGGWQGAGDESWAMDNLRVTVRGIPAPGGLAAFGLLGLAGRRRRN